MDLDSTERFWSLVQKLEGENACWIWIGHIAIQTGYGRLGPKAVHRMSWEIHNGPIPEGKRVLHTCDNRICIRPIHLFLGFGKDNSIDMVRKGRQGRQVLTFEHADLIRQEHEQGVIQAVLARQYNVTPQAIWAIIHRRVYK